MLKKLFISNLKMLVRNKQALFWSLTFPLIFTFIFGFFFGKGSTTTGIVAVINKSDSEMARDIEKKMDESEFFKTQKESDVATAKDLLKKGKIITVVVIPKDFGSQKPKSPTKIKVIYDPTSIQFNSAVVGFLDKYLTAVNFEFQKAKPIFTLEEEKTNERTINYFDFVLVGLIGMALMNSSIQGVSISMSKYREDKILKRLTTTPLKPWKFIVSEVASRLILNFIQVSLILAIGIFYFNAKIYGSILLVYVFAMLGAILFQSIGFTVAGLSRTTRAAEGMSTAVAIPMMFLAGVFFPIDQLPKWLASIVQYLPLAPLLRMIRTIALEDASPFGDPINIIIVLAWIIIMLLVATWKFRLSEE